MATRQTTSQRKRKNVAIYTPTETLRSRRSNNHKKSRRRSKKRCKNKSSTKTSSVKKSTFGKDESTIALKTGKKHAKVNRKTSSKPKSSTTQQLLTNLFKKLDSSTKSDVSTIKQSTVPKTKQPKLLRRLRSTAPIYN